MSVASHITSNSTVCSKIYSANSKETLAGQAAYSWPAFDISMPVASFTKEVNPRLAKRPLKTNGRLANRELTSLVKEPPPPSGRHEHNFSISWAIWNKLWFFPRNPNRFSTWWHHIHSSILFLTAACSRLLWPWRPWTLKMYAWRVEKEECLQ